MTVQLQYANLKVGFTFIARDQTVSKLGWIEKMTRAEASGIRLNRGDAAIVKGMINRGDRQHDIAAWFGVNGGRIGEISNGDKFSNVDPAPTDQLPAPGPYLSGRSAQNAIEALERAKEALLEAVSDIDQALTDARDAER